MIEGRRAHFPWTKSRDAFLHGIAIRRSRGAQEGSISLEFRIDKGVAIVGGAGHRYNGPALKNRTELSWVVSGRKGVFLMNRRYLVIAAGGMFIVMVT